MSQTRPDDIEIYRDQAGKFRWRRHAQNGRIVADSGQGYRTRWGACRAARRVNGNLNIYDMTFAA